MNVGTGRFSVDAEMTVLDAPTTFSGSEFQVGEAAAGKARLPTVDDLDAKRVINESHLYDVVGYV